MKMYLTDREMALVNAALNITLDETSLGNLKDVFDENDIIDLELVRYKIDSAFRKDSK